MKKLSSKELEEINGGVITFATIAIAITAMAIYEHGKHFLAGALNPFDSNEN